MNRRNVFAAALLAVASLAAQAMPSPQGATLKGEVLEVRDVEGYTYLRLKTRQGETWAAVTTAAVKKGAQVTLGDMMVMENFQSKALGKKFDRIVFASIADPGKAAAASPHGVAAAPASVAKVAKASGADGRTVAEVVAGRVALKDKPVTIRGQVVKVSSGILGKNWVHLQDGSGSAASGTHDILVTTTDTTAVGDVVNARGTVRTDVNVGPGYAYAVLVDGATIRK